MKRLIWTNEVDTSDEAIAKYRDEIKEYFNPDVPVSDEEIIRMMDDDNDDDLKCEIDNLNISTANPIVCIASLGLWNGRRPGYKLLGCNVKDIFSVTCGDYVNFYGDQYNIHCTDDHHDGTNYYIFRELIKPADECGTLFDTLIYGDEKAIKRAISRYTRSILPYAAKVYGWKVAGRVRKDVKTA